MYKIMGDLGFGDYVDDGLYDDLDLPGFTVTAENAATFLEREQHTVMPLLYKSVKKGIEEDCINVPVFRLFISLEDTIYRSYSLDEPYITMVLKRDSFTKTLYQCLEYFEQIEAYELCQQSLTLIKKLEDEY